MSVFEEIQKVKDSVIDPERPDLGADEEVLANLFPSYDKRDESQSLACPRCGCEGGLHIVAVEVNAGGSITRIDNGGTTMKAGEPDVRGTSVRVIYGCEFCDHLSALYQRFHKGHVLVRAEQNLRKWTDDDSDIWRD